MAKTQVIFDDVGQPAYAVIPWREYERLANGDADELLSDEELYDLAKSEGDESFPIEVVDRIVAGEGPIGVYRSYRGMTQQELAANAGINPVYLSQIETGKRSGSTKTLAAISRVLNVTVDDLI
ncbi:MAG: helix-turn-helix transcriptional regulator [Chloroflexota bacterium]|nr:helix-turn-helix transcriptional regulator [Chloroflexota bacterium]